MRSALLKTTETDRIDMVKAPIEVEVDMRGVYKPFKGAQTCQMRGSDKLPERELRLIGGEQCRWGAKREKARMSGSLREQIVICRHPYPGIYGESQTKHESDNDDRWVILSSLLSRS